MMHQITLYGTKIMSDIAFSLDLSQQTQTRYHATLSSTVPKDLENAFSCGLRLYRAHGRRVFLYSDREFDGSKRGQPWQYEVEGIVSFYWRGGEETIYYRLGKEGSVDLLGFWFVHLLFPFYLTLERKYDFLHAGAVEVEGKPVFFIAPSMGGKSTMTDYFIQQGHRLISDDKVATFIEDKKFMAVASHPYHRPYRKFEELGYRVAHFSEVFKPIHVFYALERVEAEADIKIEEVKGFAKFSVLLPNYLYSFHWLKSERLAYLSQMLNTIRLFRVKVPWDKERLGEVHHILCQHSKYLPQNHMLP